jgi:hypothetical protein
MKYLLLVHHSEEAFSKLSPATQQQMLNESIALTHVLHANGQYLHASPGHPESTAKIVRVRDGKSFVTDSPFVETHEQLGGRRCDRDCRAHSGRTHRHRGSSTSQRYQRIAKRVTRLESDFVTY